MHYEGYFYFLLKVGPVAPNSDSFPPDIDIAAPFVKFSANHTRLVKGAQTGLKRIQTQRLCTRLTSLSGGIETDHRISFQTDDDLLVRQGQALHLPPELEVVEREVLMDLF